MGVNSRAGGERRRETTDPGNNQFHRHRRSRPVRETEMFTQLKAFAAGGASAFFVFMATAA